MIRSDSVPDRGRNPNWFWLSTGTGAGSGGGWLGAQPGGPDDLAGQLRGQAGPRGDAELAEGVPQVGLDGRLGDEQVLGDLPVRQAVGGERGDPPLGAGERFRAGQRGAPRPGTGRNQLLP